MYNDNPIQSNPIQVNPSISKKSLMVARPSPIIKTSKGAHRIINIQRKDMNSFSINRGFTCINTYSITLIACSVLYLHFLFPLIAYSRSIRKIRTRSSAIDYNTGTTTHQQHTKHYTIHRDTTMMHQFVSNEINFTYIYNTFNFTYHWYLMPDLKFSRNFYKLKESMCRLLGHVG